VVTTRPKVTIYDVAAQAGVSISTVSLAFNNPGRVRPETLHRVLAVAEELGFRRRDEAVSRAKRSHSRVGVLAPFTSYSSFALRLNGVLSGFARSTTDVIVYDHDSAAASMSPLLASLPLSGLLDGLIIMGLPVADEVGERLARQRLSVVLVEAERRDFSSVCVDNSGGGGTVARHLLAKGHRRFAYLGEEQVSHQYRSPSEERYEGFAAELRSAGVADADIARRTVAHSVESAARATLELLDLPRPPTAVFAYDDALASGVLRAAARRGLTVPGDIAVVGFDDLDLAEALGLTTVRVPFAESGSVAAELLANQVQHPEHSARQISLQLTLVEREST
jgi:DNA-binding LacI/PurR family transcriptional regulator